MVRILQLWQKFESKVWKIKKPVGGFKIKGGRITKTTILTINKNKNDIKIVDGIS
jgi:hypothetical protein